MLLGLFRLIYILDRRLTLALPEKIVVRKPGWKFQRHSMTASRDYHDLGFDAESDGTWILLLTGESAFIIQSDSMSCSWDLREVKFDLKIAFTHVFEWNFEFLFGFGHWESYRHNFFLLGIEYISSINLTILSELTLHGSRADEFGDFNFAIKQDFLSLIFRNNRSIFKEAVNSSRKLGAKEVIKRVILIKSFINLV